jgi:hypothetical protein
MKLASSLLITALLSSTCALANPMTITNTSKNVLSVRVNGQCSREFGIIKSFTSSTVNEDVLTRLCGANAGHCIAEMYSSTSCQDRFVGYFYFSANKGTSGEGSVVAPYKMAIRTYEVVVSQ